MHPHNEDDLQGIDPIEFVRSQPSRYLAGGMIAGETMVADAAVEALQVMSEFVHCCRISPWWLICASRDWLPDTDEQIWRIFHNITRSDSRFGPNSYRFEIVLTAFAERVVAADSRHVIEIKGTITENEVLMLRDTASQHGAWKRLVGFTLPQ